MVISFFYTYLKFFKNVYYFGVKCYPQHFERNHESKYLKFTQSLYTLFVILIYVCKLLIFSIIVSIFFFFDSYVYFNITSSSAQNHFLETNLPFFLNLIL